MRPGCDQARRARQLRREQQEQVINDLLILVSLVGFAIAVYWSWFE